MDLFDKVSLPKGLLALDFSMPSRKGPVRTRTGSSENLKHVHSPRETSMTLLWDPQHPIPQPVVDQGLCVCVFGLFGVVWLGLGAILF